MGYWYEATMLRSYKDAQRLFSNCRRPHMGKPVKRWCRLFKEGNTYVLRGAYMGKDICRITPNNVVTFVMPAADIASNPYTLVSSFYKVLPLLIHRYKTGIYRVGSTAEFDKRVGTPQVASANRWRHHAEQAPAWAWLNNEAPQYFNGIKFDLKTGECLNPQPDMAKTIIPEAKSAWFKDLRRYKRGLKSRAKVGALRGYIEEENKLRTEKVVNYYHQRHFLNPWGAEKTVEQFVACIKMDKYPPDVLKGFVASSRLSWGLRPTTEQHVLENIDDVFRRNSVLLRKAYGVFGKTLHDKL